MWRESLDVASTRLYTCLFSCATRPLDLMLVLDASTSRENVFEHQRELALSLIEKLPISANDTRIAIGIK